MEMKTIIGVATGVALAAAVATGTACGTECWVGIPVREMPDVDMLAGDTIDIDLEDYYISGEGCVEALRDYDHDAPTLFAAESSDPAAVAVSIADDLTTLEIAALEAADSVRVAVRSAIGTGGGQVFLVRIRAPVDGS